MFYYLYTKNTILLCWDFDNKVRLNCRLIIFGPKKIHPKSVFKVVITNTLNQQVRLQATLENLDDPSILRQVQIHGVGQQSSKSITFNVCIRDIPCKVTEKMWERAIDHPGFEPVLAEIFLKMQREKNPNFSADGITAQPVAALIVFVDKLTSTSFIFLMRL